jgi:hypothetical protein
MRWAEVSGTGPTRAVRLRGTPGMMRGSILWVWV